MRYHVQHHDGRFIVFDYATPGPLAYAAASSYRRDEADTIAETLEQEHREQRQRDRGQTPAPRPVVVASDNTVPYFEPQPAAWQHTGAPSLLIIDAANPNHWERYVWSHARENPAIRAEIAGQRVPARSHGYAIGYYPMDTTSEIAWEMIPDGPYCAACIDPRNDYANPNTRAEEEHPQAYHAEQIDSGDEDDDGNPIPRYCAGCGEVLYDPSEE